MSRHAIVYARIDAHYKAWPSDITPEYFAEFVPACNESYMMQPADVRAQFDAD